MNHDAVRPFVLEMLQKQQEAFGSEGSEAAKEAITEEMNLQMFDSMPLRALRSFQGMTNQEVDDLIKMLQEKVNQG